MNNTKRSGNATLILLVILSIALIGFAFMFLQNITLDTMQSLVNSAQISKANNPSSNSDVVSEETDEQYDSVKDSATESIVSDENRDDSYASREVVDELSFEIDNLSDRVDNLDAEIQNNKTSNVENEKIESEKALSDKNIYDVDNNKVYHIKRGDTLSQISKETGFSVQTLAKYNDIDNVNLIYANSSLQLPSK